MFKGKHKSLSLSIDMTFSESNLHKIIFHFKECKKCVIGNISYSEFDLILSNVFSHMEENYWELLSLCKLEETHSLIILET